MKSRQKFTGIRGDVFGGLTAATVSLPFALAFGVASGLGPVAGLYCAIVFGCLSAVFGGAPGLISGPTGPMAVMMAAIVAQFSDQLELAFAVVVLAGIFQVLFGVLRLGRYINMVPFPVVSGFTTGIGVIIIILQIAPLIGHAYPGAGVVEALTRLPVDFSNANWLAALVGGITLLIILLTPNVIARVIPPELLALVGVSVAVWALALSVPLLGPIPMEWPRLQLPMLDWSSVSDILGSALVLALIGSISTLLTALIAESMTRSKNNPDRELVGQGIGNAAVALLGVMPGAGSPIRTVANIRTGGRTRFSGIVSAVSLLAIVAGLGPFFANIPSAVLAGILVKVGLDAIDWGYFKRFLRAPRAGVAIMLVVMMLTVFVDVVTAVSVGMVASSLLFVKRMTDIELENLRSNTRGLVYSKDEQDVLDRCGEGVIVYQISGPTCFGAARDLMNQISITEDCRVIALDLSEVPYIDTSSCMAVENILLKAKEMGADVIVIGMQPRVKRFLDGMRVHEANPATRYFEKRIDAFNAIDTGLSDP